MTGPIKVLLIEDSASDARLAAELLGGDSGFELTHVGRLNEAAAHLGNDDFDAVLLDLMLPDSSGLATVSSVHGQAPELPIIVYSRFGADDALFAREAVRGGAQDFLPKGFATSALMRRTILASIERKRLERDRIRHARHDPLTGLANRALLAERLERSIARAERHGKLVALLTIEPDRFSRVVELMGSPFADRLFCTMAERLRANIRRSDTLARVRERSFVAMLEGLGSTAVAGALANKLRRLMAPAFRIERQELFLTASVGMALVPAHGRKLDAILELAESAMYEVMVAGGDACRMAELPPEYLQGHSDASAATSLAGGSDGVAA